MPRWLCEGRALLTPCGSFLQSGAHGGPLGTPGWGGAHLLSTRFQLLFSRSVMSDSLGHCLRDSPGKNPGVGCHFLLQGIFPTQGSNPGLLCLLHCRQILYPLSHRGSPPLSTLEPPNLLESFYQPLPVPA